MLCVTCVQLGRNFDVSGLDEFPTKRVFSLTEAQLEERRAGLERYLHSGRNDEHSAGLTLLVLRSVSGQGYSAE